VGVHFRYIFIAKFYIKFCRILLEMNCCTWYVNDYNLFWKLFVTML